MSTLRPGTTSGAHRYRASADLSNLHAFSTPLQSRATRPASMIFEHTDKSPMGWTAAETQAHDKWLEDISRYEETLGDMASASLDQNFKEELGAIEQWFRVLSEAERTSALYSLLQQATQVQIRFFIMVLQQMARSDPLAAILSPATFNKDAMTEKMTTAMGQLSTKPQPTPSILRPSSSKLDPNTISQMFPDAAAALASQRLELNRMKNGQSPASLAPPAKDETGRTPWTPSFRKTFEPPARPRSAEPSNTAALRSSASVGTPLRSPRTTDLNPMSGPYSPLTAEPSGGNWASMTNTPASAMFPRSSLSIDSLQQRLAASEVPRSVSANQNSPRIVLESDVRKFKKPSRNESLHQTPQAQSSPIMMYDDNGQLMSVKQTQQYSSPLITRSSPMPLTATPSASGSWQVVSPANLQQSYRFSSSPVATMTVPDGYLSDNSQGRKRSTPTKLENPADPRLLADIPAWLRALRLHKYNDQLKSIPWQQLIRFDDAELEVRGIGALGARRKLLKAFETVQAAIDEGRLEGI